MRRRLRGDMIQMLKIIHGISKVDQGKLFCIDEDGWTRNHSLYLKIRKHVNSNIGLNFSLEELLIMITLQN